jgi:hypothetical protein
MRGRIEERIALVIGSAIPIFSVFFTDDLLCGLRSED